MLSKLIPFYRKKRRKTFDRLSYYKQLSSVTPTSVPLPTRRGRRGAVKALTAVMVGGASYLAFRPTTLFNRSSMELLAHFDINENIPKSGNVAYIRTPSLKPLSPLSNTAFTSSQFGATPAELAEYGDAETAVQLPSLAGVTDQNFASIRDADTVTQTLEPLSKVVGDQAASVVKDVIALAGEEAEQISKLVMPVHPGTKPDTSAFAPLVPGTKAKQPQQLASLVSPSHDRGNAPNSLGSIKGETRTLKLFSVNTGDRIESTYMRDGKYISAELKRLDWLMRDRRTGGQTKIDRSLYNLMHSLTKSVGAEGATVNIISGFRSKKTNNMLRNRSSGVASSSYHTKGMAVDLFIPGVSLSSVHKKALSLSEGGVGYYPSSNFVHIDTGPVRNWPNKYKHIARKYQRSA